MKDGQGSIKWVFVVLVVGTLFAIPLLAQSGGKPAPDINIDSEEIPAREVQDFGKVSCEVQNTENVILECLKFNERENTITLDIAIKDANLRQKVLDVEVLDERDRKKNTMKKEIIFLEQDASYWVHKKVNISIIKDYRTKVADEAWVRVILP